MVYTNLNPITIISSSIIHHSRINSKHTIYLINKASKLLRPAQLEQVKSIVSAELLSTGSRS